MKLNQRVGLPLFMTVFLTLLVSTTQAYELGPTPTKKWGSSTYGTGAVVSYSFMATGTSCAAEQASSPPSCLEGTFIALSDLLTGISGWKSEIERAFDTWASVANISFHQVDDTAEAFNAAGDSGDIRLGAHTFEISCRATVKMSKPDPDPICQVSAESK